MYQTLFVDERLQFEAEFLQDVHAVASTDSVQIDTVGEPKAREQRVAEPLVGGQPPDVLGDRLARPDAPDVLLGGRRVLPADTVARRVRPAAEPEPLAV